MSTRRERIIKEIKELAYDPKMTAEGVLSQLREISDELDKLIESLKEKIRYDDD